jgi:flagellin
MSLTITNNVASLTAQHNVGRSSNALKTSLERLSSGLKINRGADGPAALVISEKQRTQIAGLRQAIDNTEKAVSLVQTAEGALNEINSLLTKIRSLAIDSANAGVNDEDTFEANQAEIDNALETIDRIANNTQFGTKKLLDGSSGISGTPSDPNLMTFLKATGDTNEGSYVVTVSSAGTRAVITAATQTANLAQDEILSVNGVNVTLFAGMSQNEVVDRINEFTSLTGARAEIDSGNTRLYSTVFGTMGEVNVISNRAPAGDTSGFANTATSAQGTDVVVDVDGDTFTGQGNVVTVESGLAKGLSLEIAQSTTDATSTVAAASAATVTVTDSSLVFQIGPNQLQTAEIAIDRAHSQSLGIGVANNQFANLSEINVTNANKAQDAMAIIDAAVDDITNLRGALGAFQQNTLESTGNNLRATLENTINAESVIRDTDFAEEIAEFTKQQVMMQAGTSVLGNANQIPQLVLSLLN